MIQDDKVIKALKEASVSVAILVEEVSSLQKDLEHVQNQITIIENAMEEK